MTTPNPINSVAYLRTSREFPNDLDQLCVEVNKTYLELAQAINVRTIGLYSTNRPSITGNSYFLTSSRQQTLRQVYTFTSTTAINHNILNINPSMFTNCYGNYTDGTNGYGLFFATSVAIAGQITFYVTATQIVFVVGAGAPVITSGRVVLEWISNI